MEMQDNSVIQYEAMIKIIIIGESGVGKSNILSQYVNKVFDEDTLATVGVDFSTKSYELQNGGGYVRAQIWDTAGQERFKSVTTAHYKGSQGCLLVYDITNKESFTNLDNWLQEIRDKTSECRIVLIGNKNDLEEERVVTIEEAEQFASINSIEHFLETSALNSNNVELAFQNLIEETYKYVLQNKGEGLRQNNSLDKNTQKVDFGNQKKKKSCC